MSESIQCLTFTKEKQKDEPFPTGSQRVPVIQLYGTTLSISHCFEPSLALVLRKLIGEDQKCILGSGKWCFSLFVLWGFGLIGLEQGGFRHPELCSRDALVPLYAAPLCIPKLMLILPLQRLHFASGDSIFKALNISGRIFTSCHIPLLKFLVNRGRLWRLPTPERFFSQFFLLQGCLSQDLFSIPPEDFLSLGTSLKSFLVFRPESSEEFWYPLTSSCLWDKPCSLYSVCSL